MLSSIVRLRAEVEGSLVTTIIDFGATASGVDPTIFVSVPKIHSCLSGNAINVNLNNSWGNNDVF